MKRTLLTLLLMFGCATAFFGCANHRWTDGDVPVDDPVVTNLANRLYSIETALVLSGKAALTARRLGHIDDNEWDRFADLSSQVNVALKEAKGMLIEYRRVSSAENSTRMGNAMHMVDTLTAAILRFAQALEDDNGQPILGSLEVTP